VNQDENEVAEPRAGGAAGGQPPGILFVMTGASGVGKDTIRTAAAPFLANVYYSISATTRGRRPGEENGVQYYFLTREAFERMIAEKALLEYADYVGDYYGTPEAAVREALDRGQDVLLELELAGARQVKQRMPEAVMLFIVPPSLQELERRLRGRGTDSEEKIQKRLARAREEIRAVREFDYFIVNDDLPRAVLEFESVIRAERARAKRVTDEHIAEFLRTGSATGG
jgi:guanylate kinase